MLISIPLWLFVVICVLLLPYLMLAIGITVYIICAIYDYTIGQRKYKKDYSENAPYFVEGKGEDK